MTLIRFACVLCLVSTASAQDYKAESMKTAPPDAVTAPLRKELAEEGTKILTADGKPFAEIWLRKAIPATAKPAGPNGTIQLPFLAEGEFLGVVKFSSEGHDYRDQTIPPGVYTLRYGIQPVNGDHLGVSPFRDYGLLLPAKKDGDVAALPKKKLETQSAETAGAAHPAVLMLLTLPSGTKVEPRIVKDESKNTSGVVLGLPLSAPGSTNREVLVVQLIVAGMAM